MNDIEISTADGFRLAASRWEGRGDRSIVIAPGVGIRRTFYGRLAEFLSENGYGVITFDHRGIGDSLRGPIRGSDASMTTWSKLDTSAVVRHARRETGGQLTLIAHSGGGQMLGMLDNADEIDAAVFVTAQSGYWKHWPLPYRLALGLLWHFVMPLTTSILGYFPARLIGAGEDLPSGVAREWSRWARSPGYLFDHASETDLERYRSFDRPILSWSFEDDTYAPLAAVRALNSMYDSASIDHRHRSPSELGLDSVDHFGYFRPKARESLWIPTVEWLERVRSLDNSARGES